VRLKKPRGAPLTAISLAAATLVFACSESTSTAPPAAAEKAPDAEAVYRGAAIARQVCAQCHDIGDGSAPAIYSKASTFKSVVEKPETSAIARARAFLRTPKPGQAPRGYRAC
jgi:mono/diheme cytochrome c family protein